MQKTKEQIDEIFEIATKNNLLDLANQLNEAMQKIPEQNENPIAYAIFAANIAQTNVMLAFKEICYKLMDIEN